MGADTCPDTFSHSLDFEPTFTDMVDNLAAELQLITELGRKVEKGLTLEFEHWLEKTGSRLGTESEEAREWLAESAGDAKWLLSDEYPQLVRGAVLLIIFGRAERWVGDLWCEVAHRQGIAPLRKWGVTADRLREAGCALSLDLTSVGGAAGRDVDNAWQLRNVVAHHCASLRAWEESGYATDPSLQHVRELVRDHDLLTETRAGTLLIAAELNDWVARALTRVLAGLAEELDGRFAMPACPELPLPEGAPGGEDGSGPSS